MAIDKLTERCDYLTAELTRALSGEIDAMKQERADFDSCRIQYERKAQNEQDIQAWGVETHNISYQLKSAIESLNALRGETVDDILSGVMVPDLQVTPIYSRIAKAPIGYVLENGDYVENSLPGMDTSSIDTPNTIAESVNELPGVGTSSIDAPISTEQNTLDTKEARPEYMAEIAAEHGLSPEAVDTTTEEIPDDNTTESTGDAATKKKSTRASKSSS